MEKIDFKKQNIPFTQVANGVLYDKALSLEAKTVYAFMYSKPDGWHFSANRMGQELNISKPTVLKYLNELREHGYLISQKQSNGRMLYKVVFPPLEPQSNSLTMAKKPQSKKAMVKKSHGEDSLPISNKDIYSNKEEESNKELTGVKKQDGVNEVFKVFYNSINPTINYGNRAYRKAVEDLVSKFGLEKTIRLAEYAVKVHEERYAPSISNPLQLKEKYPQLLKFFNLNNQNQIYEYNND